MQRAIVIPIYKQSLSSNEIYSVKQCLTIFNNHPVVFVHPKSLNLKWYHDFLKNYSNPICFEAFNTNYFKSTVSYNKLMLSLSFYCRLKRFEYILIYQTDCFVFRDELEYWCNKGYDFIGSPLFNEKSYNNGQFEICGIGNGGFSLRKVRSFIRVLTSMKKTETFSTIYALYKDRKGIIRKFKGFFKLLRTFLFGNNTFFY